MIMREKAGQGSAAAMRLAVIILLTIGSAGCSRFILKPSAESLRQEWPQLGGGPGRNAVLALEPLFPLRPLWARRAMSAINPSLIGMEDWIVFGTKQGKLEGYNLLSGKGLGRISGRPTFALTCALGKGGLVIVRRLGAHNLIFYDLATGKKKWKRSIGAFWGEPLIVGERLYLVTLRGRVLCLALEDGRTLAEAQLAHDCLAAPAWSDSILAVGDDRGTLYGFDGRLRQLWQMETGAALRAPAVASRGQFFIGSSSGRFLALDAASGAVRWEFISTGKFFHAAAAADSLVIVSSTDHRVHALSREDGHPIWQQELDAIPRSAPVICGSAVFIGAADKRLLALSLDDGRELWSFTAKGRIASAPIVYNNQLFFAAEDDYLYCFALR